MSDERSVFVIKLPSPMVTAWARLDAPVTTDLCAHCHRCAERAPTHVRRLLNGRCLRAFIRYAKAEALRTRFLLLLRRRDVVLTPTTRRGHAHDAPDGAGAF